MEALSVAIRLCWELCEMFLSDVGAAYETEVAPTHVLWPWAVSVKTRVLSRSVSTVSANWMDLDPFLTTGNRLGVGRSLVQAEAPER